MKATSYTKIMIVMSFILTTILAFSSCNHSNTYSFGVGKSDTHPFCNDVHLIKGDTITWSSTGNNQDEVLGTFFHYHEGDSVRTKFIWSDTWYYASIIRGHIVDYAYNDGFLLADQKPIDSILGKEITIYSKDGRYSYSRREYDTVNQYDAYWKMLDNSPVIHQYWIMVVKTADIYGPLSYEDYLDMKKQLGVPSTLMLKREKESLNNN